MIKIVSAHEPLAEGKTRLPKAKPLPDIWSPAPNHHKAVHFFKLIVNQNGPRFEQSRDVGRLSKAEISLNKIEQGFSLWLRVL